MEDAVKTISLLFWDGKTLPQRFRSAHSRFCYAFSLY